MSEENKNKEQPFGKRLMRMFFRVSLFAFGFTFLLSLIFVIYVATHLPPMGELENPRLDLSTQIYSSDGELLGNIYSTENRIFTPIKDISKNVIDALVATEDIRFYDHNGVDPMSMLNLVYRNIVKGQRSGGSTITMQLSRNLYDQVGKDDSFLRKMKEMVVSVILERRFTKEEIMQAYLNTSSFYGDTYGIEMGSRTLFGKSAKDLEIHEATLLVGLLKNPTYYNPVFHKDRALHRRNTVINQMVKYGKLSSAKGEKIKKMDLGLKYSRARNQKTAQALYFRAYVKKYLLEWAKGKNIDLYRDGLRVYTTVDSRMQRYAEMAVEEHLSDLQKQFDKEIIKRAPWNKSPDILNTAIQRSYRYISMKRDGASKSEIEKAFNTKEKMRIWTWEGERDTILSPKDSLIHYLRFLETGFVAMEPNTGEIKAWVGGINPKLFQYDHVAEGKRQVGSTFKPLVYAAAVSRRQVLPCDRVLDIPVSIELPDGKMYTPKNSGGGDLGMMNYFEGLARSLNQVTASVMKTVTPEVVCQYARDLGIESKLECVPALCLGTSDLNVLELTRAYCAFANHGYNVEPVFITRIEDKNGRVLEEFHSKSSPVLDSTTAYTIATMLMNVVDQPYGTAHRLRTKYHFKNQIGGKTGTTQNNSDGWFMGITPHLVGGCWVGASDRRIRFSSTAYGQGANMALPIWAIFMKYVYADRKYLNIPQDPFKKPSKFDITLVCPPLKRDDGLGLPTFND